MTYKLSIEQPAEADIKGTYRWYKDIQPGLEIRLRISLRMLFGRILQFPQAYPVVGRKFRRALVSGFPYAVYYMYDDMIIHIFAVMHTSRDPEIWRSREH